MEQLAARRAHNPKVAGSSPAPATSTMFNKNWIALLGAFLLLNVARAQIPDLIANAILKTNIPTDNVAFMVQEVDSTTPLLQHNIAKPMNPASVMKLLTSYAALKKLGHQYTWKTHFFSDSALDEHGVLNGNLYIQGGGDPFLTFDILEALFHRLKRQGLKSIRGNIVLDRSAFNLPDFNPSAFDGAGMRPYNTPPNALLLDFQTIALEFSTENGILNVAPIIPLKNFQLDFANVAFNKKACGRAWENQLTFHAHNTTLSINGKMPICNKEHFYIMPFDALTHAQMLIGGILEETHIDFNGHIQDGVVPKESTLLLRHESEPLLQALKSVNKYSNNVMARHLFLSLSLGKNAANLTKSRVVLNEVLHQQGLNFPELVIENGSGLSRRARISTEHLNQLLLVIWRDSLMPELVSTLPVIGLDGTLKRRYKNHNLKGKAHFKTGTLNDAKALAGFFHAQNGKRYALSILIHDSRAYAAQPIVDALLDWLDTQNL